MPLTIVGGAGAGSGAWNELDADIYDATLTLIEDGGKSQFDDKDQYKITFTLDLEDEVGDQIVLYKWVNQVLNPQSNVATVLAACGVPWEPGTPTDLTQLHGKRCRVMVNISDKTGKRYIAEVLAPKAAAAAGKAAPKAAAKTAVPAQPTPISETPCCVPGCKREIDSFDTDGNAFCAKHKPDDGE